MGTCESQLIVQPATHYISLNTLACTSCKCVTLSPILHADSCNTGAGTPFMLAAFDTCPAHHHPTHYSPATWVLQAPPPS